MQIEEHDKLVKLFDIYGALLSKKQNMVIEKHLNLDLGESELAVDLGETRQAVHDALVKAKKQLISFEAKCKVYQTFEQVKQKLNLLRDNLGDDNAEAKQMIENISNEI